MAMFGGMALIGPMLCMTLCNSTNTSLITVSVTAFIFALIFAWGAIGSAGKDVLAATAAYAVVLMVLVGTNSSASWRGIKEVGNVRYHVHGQRSH
jgi:hypothetical protein